MRRLGMGQGEGAFLFRVFVFSSLTVGTKDQARPSCSVSPSSQRALTHLISLPWQHSPSSNLMQCHSVIQQGRILEKRMEKYSLFVGSLVKTQYEDAFKQRKLEIQLLKDDVLKYVNLFKISIIIVFLYPTVISSRRKKSSVLFCWPNKL